MASGDHPFAAMEATLKKVAPALREADLPFLLGGSLACWVRGGPESRKDLDFMVKPEDAERALAALSEAGMRAERPPEDWLLKVWDGEVLVDLIFHPVGLEITDEVIERGDELNVFSIQMPVMALEDVIATKLLALNDHALDYESLLQISRSVREQVDWAEVRERTAQSPYARAFFALLAELDLMKPTPEHRGAHVRLVSGSAE
jgi:putative nucleotidyltransferase-like protein